jgi:hypothetical protein
MKTILLISPYWREKHRWMVSSYKLAELWQRLGYRVVAVCMGAETRVETVSETLTVHYRKDLFLPDPLNFGIALGFTGYVRKLIKQEKPDLIVCILPPLFQEFHADKFFHFGFLHLHVEELL